MSFHLHREALVRWPAALVAAIVFLFIGAGLLPSCAGTDELPETPPEPQAERTAVPEGINARFLDAQANAEEWAVRWEMESREVFAEKGAIVAAIGLEPGDRIADVGTGTGLFLGPFDRAVGAGGKVFAVDIAPAFVAHVERRAEREEMDSVEAVLSNERSIELPSGSVDHVFLCDTYHHFEYHQDMLYSIRRALRPGGQLVVVDFDRIPGVSRDWILGHVRAGKDVVTGEILEAGFRLDREVDIEGFEENWMRVFVRD